MVTSNLDIMRSYFDEIVNQKKMEKFSQFVHEKFIAHGTPYVGMGIASDDSSKDKVIIGIIYPGGPADGKLQIGDEILQVQDGKQTWNTFEELRSGSWGQGVPGSTVTISVSRAGVKHKFQLVRSMIEGFQFTFSMVKNFINQNNAEWPDLNFRPINILEAGDTVAYYGVNQGHNNRFGHSAVWGECGIVRFQEGKIIEWWSQEDSYSWMKQLGYTIQEPVPVKE